MSLHLDGLSVRRRRRYHALSLDVVLSLKEVVGLQHMRISVLLAVLIVMKMKIKR